MGAGNSTPQTVRIDNPQRVVPIQITPSVLSRLEEQQKQQQENGNGNENVKEMQRNNEEQSKMRELQDDNNQKQRNPYIQSGQIQETPHNWSEANDEIQQKYKEHEEYQFDKTLEKLEEILGKPVDWTDEIEEQIKGIRKELIKCYSENPEQTLCCADIANKYQQLIFRQQYRSILKFNAEIQKQEPPPPPHQHSPPYN